MSHGQAQRPIESEDGTTLKIEAGEALVKAKTTEELLGLLLDELQEIKTILKMAIE